MTIASTSPVAGESLAEAAERISSAIPIRAQTATNEECAARRDAIDATLIARCVWQRERCWHTAQLVDGQIAGVWARSTEEAELDLTVWFGTRCHWVIADPVHAVRAEYFPHGIRRHTDACRRFPLAPPRRPRDQFAAADSLLEQLGPADNWPGPLL